MKVLIVGAGPTGQTAALEFVRHGIKPEIVDAKTSPSELSRAVGVLPDTIERLRPSGVGERMIQEGIKLKKLRLRVNEDILFQIDVSKVLDPEAMPISIPQDQTERIMSDVLAKHDVRVQYNCKVTDIETSDNEATATFANGETKTYDWIIGADGVNSTVREQIGIAFEGFELPETWSIADLELEHLEEPDTFLAWIIDREEKDVIVMAPIGKNRVRLISSTPDCVAASPIPLKIKKERRVGTFKISIRQAEQYVKGRVVLAGDSAHAHSPVGGRGMNLGIDDAVEVVAAILEGSVDQYNTQRKRIAQKVINGTEFARKTLLSSNPLVKVMVRAFFFIIGNVLVLRRLFVRTAFTLRNNKKIV